MFWGTGVDSDSNNGFNRASLGVATIVSELIDDEFGTLGYPAPLTVGSAITNTSSLSWPHWAPVCGIGTMNWASGAARWNGYHW